MAQVFPTSASAIYDVLSEDSELLSYIGTYNFSNTESPLTALSIVSAGENLPALRNVTGVECIIQDAGNIEAKEFVTGESEPVTTWSVFLIAWNPSKGSDLQNAALRICELFVGANAIQTVATPDGLGSLVQTKITIRSDQPIRA